MYKPEGDFLCKSLEVLKNTECFCLVVVRVGGRGRLDR